MYMFSRGNAIESPRLGCRKYDSVVEDGTTEVQEAKGVRCRVCFLLLLPRASSSCMYSSVLLCLALLSYVF